MPSSSEPSPYALRVLAVVELIPAGTVLTYGDVREWLGESSARAVGVVLSRHGREVPWWRVILATGEPAPVGDGAAGARLRDEGVPFLASGHVDLAHARWDGTAVGLADGVTSGPRAGGRRRRP